MRRNDPLRELLKFFDEVDRETLKDAFISLRAAKCLPGIEGQIKRIADVQEKRK